jgi:hypothetical protein
MWAPPRKTTIDPIYKKKLEAGNSTTTHHSWDLRERFWQNIWSSLIRPLSQMGPHNWKRNTIRHNSPVTLWAHLCPHLFPTKLLKDNNNHSHSTHHTLLPSISPSLVLSSKAWTWLRQNCNRHVWIKIINGWSPLTICLEDCINYLQVPKVVAKYIHVNEAISSYIIRGEHFLSGTER